MQHGPGRGDHMKVALLTDPGIGGTFVSWSIYYLTGHRDYWYFRTNKTELLTNEPLTGINAHCFQPNQIRCSADISMLVDRTPVNDDLLVVYAHPMPLDVRQPEINQMTQFADRVLVMTVPSQHHFYHYRYQGRTLTHKLSDPTQRNQSWQEQHEDFLAYYFAADLAKWQEMGLTETWDRREFLALNLRPYESSLQIKDMVPLKSNHLYLDARDAWFMLDQSIKDIVSWLGLEIDTERQSQWQAIYDSWRTLHYNRVKFYWYFPNIIDAILTGQDMDLTRFQLDIVQEAVIQHELIYRHGLNFRTWGLQSFGNTRDLHNLLEPNPHPVVQYGA